MNYFVFGYVLSVESILKLILLGEGSRELFSAGIRTGKIFPSVLMKMLSSKHTLECVPM